MKNLRKYLDSAGGTLLNFPWDNLVALPPADVIKQ